MLPTIILINGAGSSGKSLIAREIQRISKKIYLHVQMDVFIEMLPDHLQNDKSTFQYLEHNNEQSDKPYIEIITGHQGEKLLKRMRHAMLALANVGNNLIIDDVILDHSFDDYISIFKEFKLFKVGVMCDLQTLEQREKLRGDRMLGLSRWQYNKVHSKKKYDLTINTTFLTKNESANLILSHIEKPLS